MRNIKTSQVLVFLFHPSANFQWNSVDSMLKRGHLWLCRLLLLLLVLHLKKYLSVRIWIDYWIFAQNYINIWKIRLLGDMYWNNHRSVQYVWFWTIAELQKNSIFLVHPEQGPFGGFNFQSKWQKSTSYICSALGHSCRHVTKLSGILWQCYIVPLF